MQKERPGSDWSLEKKGNLGIKYKGRCWKKGEKETLFSHGKSGLAMQPLSNATAKNLTVLLRRVVLSALE